MRISTRQFFHMALKGLTDRNTSIAKLTEQLDGKRVHAASDDPVLAAKISLLKNRISYTEQQEKNRVDAEGKLNLELGIISNAVQLMHNLKEKQIQAGSSLSQNDRKSIKEEVDALAKQMLEYANARDGEGGYLFSGSKTNTKPFSWVSSGVYAYHGDDTQRFQDIGNSVLMALNDPGKGIFMEMPDGNGDFSIKGGSNTGTATVHTGQVVDRNLVTNDTYTMRFATNSSNQTVVMVTGVSGGNIIPATGNPDDAPVYEKGMEVQFDGLSIKVEGEPVDGDTYSIQPSQNISMFSIIQRMMDNLDKSTTTPSDKAAITTENNQLMAELDHAMEKMLSIQSRLGSRLNQLDVGETTNAELLISTRKTLQSLEEIPIDDVILSLNTEMSYLQIAQMSFVKIQSLSAFQYMR